MPVTGEPKELRALAAQAKRLADELTNSFRALDNKHHVTRYSVANKVQVDDLYKQASARVKSTVDTLMEIQRRMQKIALDLEQVNRS